MATPPDPAARLLDEALRVRDGALVLAMDSLLPGQPRAQYLRGLIETAQQAIARRDLLEIRRLTAVLRGIG